MRLTATLVLAATLTACVVPTGPTAEPTTKPPTHQDVAYGPVTACPDPTVPVAYCGGSQTIDIYTPRVAPELREDGPGTIIYFHGGGGVGGDKTTDPELGYLLRQVDRGWDVASVNYRLGSSTNALTDAHRSVAWLRQSNLVNTGRVIVAGHSIGGTLAALVATTGPTQVDGWMGIAPLLDLCEPDATRWWVQRWIHLAECGRLSPWGYMDRTDPSGWVVWDPEDPIASGVPVAGVRAVENGDRTRLWVNPSTGGHHPMPNSNAAAFDNWLNWIAA